MLTRLLLCLSLVIGFACGGDDQPREVVRRKAPGASPEKKKHQSTNKDSGEATGDADAEPKKLKLARRELTREDFDLTTRDPFQGFVIGEGPADDVQIADSSLTQRRSVMSEYDFEDLKLVGIVKSKGSIQSRALFVASDHKSYSVKQGEYFSRAEVLLAAINHDYIEIEVVDEDLAGGLNLAQGERRAIYLKTE